MLPRSRAGVQVPSVLWLCRLQRTASQVSVLFLTSGQGKNSIDDVKWETFMRRPHLTTRQAGKCDPAVRPGAGERGWRLAGVLAPEQGGVLVSPRMNRATSPPILHQMIEIKIVSIFIKHAIYLIKHRTGNLPTKEVLCDFRCNGTRKGGARGQDS